MARLCKYDQGRSHILKYKNLTTETWDVWNVKIRVAPVTTMTSATISKSEICDVQGKHDIKELQKTTILGNFMFFRPCIRV
jgi:hypothetical protein